MAYAVLGADHDRRYRHTHRFFSRLYRLAAHQRPLVARLDGRIVASTNDLVGGACRARPSTSLRSLPALALTGPRAAVRAARWFNDWERRDPDRPHAHFGPFGVEPELQGRGIGSLVLREYTRRLDEAGEHSYLETEKPENVALYALRLRGGRRGRGARRPQLVHVARGGRRGARDPLRGCRWRALTQPATRFLIAT